MDMYDVMGNLHLRCNGKFTWKRACFCAFMFKMKAQKKICFMYFLHLVFYPPLHDKRFIAHTMLTGWWLVSHDGREGWAPSSYLEPLEPATETGEKEESQGSYVVVSRSQTLNARGWLHEASYVGSYGSYVIPSIGKEALHPHNVVVALLSQFSSCLWSCLVMHETLAAVGDRLWQEAASFIHSPSQKRGSYM